MSSLKTDIAALQQELDSSIPGDARKLMQRSVQRVVESAIAESALGAGEEFPMFSLPNVVGNAVSSEELLANGPLVVSFYRGGWCPFCNLELRAYQTLLDDIRQ